MAIDPATGAIRAMTAVSPGRKNNQFNLIADARRQPGSTFKAFVLATAIEQGMNPESTYYLSAPFHCDTGPCAVKPWDPETYDHTYTGSTSVASATLRSDNTVYARLTLDVGAENVAKMARKLGVRTPLDVNGAYVPSMGLGSIAVTPLDMASAYATLAARGIYSKPMAITKVVLPKGQEDTKAGWGKPDRKQVISPGVAYEVTKILQDNVLSGTGVAANFGKPAAGKTGTTENHADAWFSGYTPQLEATVWMGYQAGEIPMLTCTASPSPAAPSRRRSGACSWRRRSRTSRRRLPPADHVADVQGLARRVAVQRRLVHADARRTTARPATTPPDDDDDAGGAGHAAGEDARQEGEEEVTAAASSSGRRHDGAAGDHDRTSA